MLPQPACEGTGMILAAEYIPSPSAAVAAAARTSLGNRIPRCPVFWDFPIPDRPPGIGKQGIPFPDSAGTGVHTGNLE
jgi:hypothetical protein